MKRIYRLISLYIHHSGGARFPADMKSIALMTKRKEIFECSCDVIVADKASPEIGGSYELVNNPLTGPLSGLAPSRVAIVAEKRPAHGGRRSVLFFDGSVKCLDEAAFERLKSNAFVD